MAADRQEGVLVTGFIHRYNFDEIATVKYDALTGDSIWAARYENSSDQVAFAVGVDDYGNSYVTGATRERESFDYLTIKYSPGGTMLWSAIYDGPGGSSDLATDLAVDPQGRAVAVTGYSMAGSQFDFATILCGHMPGGPVQEPEGPTSGQVAPAATICRGVLLLPRSSFDTRHSTLLDASGRRVLDLNPGPNDIRQLSPGMYFVREHPASSSQHSGPTTTHKVIVTR